MTRGFTVLAVVLVLLAPFGEGGRAPASLLVLHTLVLLAALLAFRRFRERGLAALAPGPPRTMAMILGAGLLAAACSAARAPYFFAAGLGLIDLAAPAVLFIAAIADRPAAGDLALVRSTVVASTTLQAILALGRWPAGGAIAAAGAFLNPDQLGAFLNIGILLSAWRAADLLEQDRRRAGLFWAGLGALHLAAILLLMSRGALLGLAAGLALFGGIRLRSRPRRARFIAAGLVILILSAGAGLVVLRFAQSEDPFRYDRLRIWRSSAGLLLEKPWLGIGPGMLRHEGPRHAPPNEFGPFRYNKIFTGAHSAPLTLSVEIGLPGALLFLLAAGACIIRLLRVPGRSADDPIGVATGAALLALLAQASVEDLPERPALVLVPALLAGMALAARRGEERTAIAGTAGGSLSAGRVDWRTATLLTGSLYMFTAGIALPFAADAQARAARRAGPKGLPAMQRAAWLNPLQPDYRHDLAMASLNSGPLTPERYAEAATHLLAARRLKPIDVRFPLLLGRLEARAGRFLFEDAGSGNRAIEWYGEAVDLAPTDPRPRLEMAGLLDDLGRPREALEMIREALKKEPHFVRARILEGSLLLRLGRGAEAAASYRALDETLAILRTWPLDSGYARDLAADAPAERGRLAAALGVGAAQGP